MILSAHLIPALLSAAAATAEGTAITSSAPTQDAPPVEYPQWSGALTAGALMTDGNSENFSANAAFNAQRRGENDRWTYDAFWNWAQQNTDSSTTPGDDRDDPDVTTLNYGGGVKYDYFQTKKLYYYGNGSGKVDPIADLDLRYILGAGLGYQVREDEKLKWGTELGLSYLDENYQGSTDDSEFVALRLASNLAWVLSSRTTFEQVAEAYPGLETTDDFVAKLDNRLKMILTGKWIAQIQYVLDFTNSTPPGIEEADHRVVLGIGWSFGA